MVTDIQQQSKVKTKPQESNKNESPNTVGQLVGEVCLAVHTHQAQRLIWGRRQTAQKSPITGLIAFASSVNTIWQAAEGGDPYALWWLIKIEAGIGRCRDYLKDQLADVGSLYPDSEILEVDTAESERPHRTRLAFSNPYAYRSAYMLGEYDVLVRTCHTLKFVGAAEPVELMTVVALAGQQVRRVFAIPQSFKVCGIDKDDIRQNNQRAQRAIELMGPLPGDILKGEVLPLFVPATTKVKLGALSRETVKEVERKVCRQSNGAAGDADGECLP
jgi:integrating conjugative element protein (TIGR03761 family)